MVCCKVTFNLLNGFYSQTLFITDMQNSACKTQHGFLLNDIISMRLILTSSRSLLSLNFSLNIHPKLTQLADISFFLKCVLVEHHNPTDNWGSRLTSSQLSTLAGCCCSKFCTLLCHCNYFTFAVLRNKNS